MQRRREAVVELAERAERVETACIEVTGKHPAFGADLSPQRPQEALHVDPVRGQG